MEQVLPKVTDIGKYKIVQSSNFHVSIYENGIFIFHCEYREPQDPQEALNFCLKVRKNGIQTAK